MVGGKNLKMLLINLMKKIIALLPKSAINSPVENREAQIIWGNVVAHPPNDRIQNIREEAKNC